MDPSLRFQDGSRTDRGSVRTTNEDACLARGDTGLWAVADGMGGHARGRWASTQIMAALRGVALPADFDGAVAKTREALHRANTTISRATAREGRIIGSTVAALVVRGRRFAALWVGDSRVYRLRNNELSLLTTDHSQVEQMVAAGLLSREEADVHPMNHVLSRAVGVGDQLTLDVRVGDVLPADVFLLCSDGLTRTVPDHEIGLLLSRGLPSRAASALVDLALRREVADNVTVVVVGCDESTHVTVG